jgi:predicted phage terminase large subunit-like protein
VVDPSSLTLNVDRAIARKSFGDFCGHIDPFYKTGRHIKIMVENLEALFHNDIQKLAIFMPPRHSKSLHASERFPAWWLGNRPSDQIILASFTADVATKSARKARAILAAPSWPFPGVSLDPTSKAAREWRTNKGGVLKAAGIQGTVTSYGAHLLAIDDPFSGRAEADSLTYRNMAWDFYIETARTRLMPMGKELLMQCMTGDTSVTMADGTLRRLDQIKVGDLVATYDQGYVSSASVLGWKNQGDDQVFSIITNGGVKVRANARHPFLVKRKGENAWVRLSDIRVGDKIASISCYGKALLAPLKDATCQQGPRASARHITTKTDGIGAFARLRSRLLSGVKRIYAIATDLKSQNSKRCFCPKTVDAPSAFSHLLRSIRALIGQINCASITTTTREQCEDSFATTATSCSHTRMISQQSFEQQPIISKVTPSREQGRAPDFNYDTVYAIVPDGKEIVYDVQIERTENFIANGLVSHNTRWHEDDLAGRILNSPGSEQWTVLEMPALAMCPICESIVPCIHGIRDSIGRLPGEELWPEFGLVIPRPGKDPIGNRAFWSVYQQKPRPDAGNLFQRDWMKRRWKALPAMTRVVFFVDGAWETGVANDRSAIACWGTNGIDYYLIDAWADRVTYPDLKAKFKDYYRRWSQEYPTLVPLVEKAASGMALVQEMSADTGIPIIGVGVHKKKFARAESISHVFESGKVVLPESAPWLDDWIEEHTGFPAMTHDDYVDTTSGALTRLLEMMSGGVFDEAFDATIHATAIPANLPPFAYDPRRPLMLAAEFTPGKFTALVAQWRAQEAYRDGVIIERDAPRDRWRYPVPDWQQRLIYIFDEIVLQKADADPSEFAARFIERFGLQARQQGVILFGGPSGNSQVQLDASTNWAIFARELTQAGISWQSQIETVDPGIEQRVNALKAQLKGVDGYGLAVDAARCQNFVRDMNEVQWSPDGRRLDTKKEAMLASAAQAASHLAHRLRVIAQTREVKQITGARGDFFAR